MALFNNMIPSTQCLRVKHPSEQGLALVETVVAIVIFTTMVVAFLPLFLSFKATTIRNDIRLGAVAVTQQVMDELRRIDPGKLPATGNNIESFPTVTQGGTGASTAAMPYKGKTYRVAITYCNPSTDCIGDTRRISVKTYHSSNDDPIFQVETVYTKLTPPTSN
jgi:type II secretory pathway pseudopilin PulG